jgi:hypothetical protein
VSHWNVIDPDSEFCTGEYTITRRAAPTWTDGIKVDGAVTTIADVPMSVQPVKRSMRAPAEGQHTEVTHIAYSQAELIPRSPAYAGDLVSHNGESFLVIGSKRWEAFGDVHWVADLARQVTP